MLPRPTWTPNFHFHPPSHHNSFSASLFLVKVPVTSVCAQGHEEKPHPTPTRAHPPLSTWGA